MNTILKLKISIIIISTTLISDCYSRQARCFIIPVKNSGVSGEVQFFQDSQDQPVRYTASIYGASKIHGFHIHEKGELGNDCMDAGSHFNPYNKTHGGPDMEIRHVGDLGNFVADKKIISFEGEDSVISLYDESRLITGRSCVLHADEDDLGLGGQPDSKTTGHAGARISCGLVQDWNPKWSLVFGFSVLFVSIGLIVFYFLVANKKEEENTVKLN